MRKSIFCYSAIFALIFGLGSLINNPVNAEQEIAKCEGTTISCDNEAGPACGKNAIDDGFDTPTCKEGWKKARCCKDLKCKKSDGTIFRVKCIENDLPSEVEAEAPEETTSPEASLETNGTPSSNESVTPSAATPSTTTDTTTIPTTEQPSSTTPDDTTITPTAEQPSATTSDDTTITPTTEQPFAATPDTTTATTATIPVAPLENAAPAETPATHPNADEIARQAELNTLNTIRETSRQANLGQPTPAPAPEPTPETTTSTNTDTGNFVSGGSILGGIGGINGGIGGGNSGLLGGIGSVISAKKCTSITNEELFHACCENPDGTIKNPPSTACCTNNPALPGCLPVVAPAPPASPPTIDTMVQIGAVDGSNAGADTTTTTATPQPTSTTTEPTSTTTTPTTTTTETQSATSTTNPICGNGILEAGELCEPPGIQAQCMAGQICNVNCQCGNGILPEVRPLPSPVCGNSMIEAPEECDPPGDEPACGPNTGSGVCKEDCSCEETPPPSNSPPPVEDLSDVVSQNLPRPNADLTPGPSTVINSLPPVPGFPNGLEVREPSPPEPLPPDPPPPPPPPVCGNSMIEALEECDPPGDEPACGPNTGSGVCKEDCSCEETPEPPSQQDCESLVAPSCGSGMCDDSNQVCRVLESDMACHCLDPLPSEPTPTPTPSTDNPPPTTNPPSTTDSPSPAPAPTTPTQENTTSAAQTAAQLANQQLQANDTQSASTIQATPQTTTEGSVATDESQPTTQPESPPAPEPITRTTTEGCSYLPLEGNPSAGACLTLGQSCTINNQMGSCRTSTPEESMTTLCLCIPDSPPTTSTTTGTESSTATETTPTESATTEQSTTTTETQPTTTTEPPADTTDTTTTTTTLTTEPTTTTECNPACTGDQICESSSCVTLTIDPLPTEITSLAADDMTPEQRRIRLVELRRILDTLQLRLGQIEGNLTELRAVRPETAEIRRLIGIYEGLKTQLVGQIAQVQEEIRTLEAPPPEDTTVTTTTNTTLTTEPTTTNTDTTTTQPTSTNTFPAVETLSPTIPTQESMPLTTGTDLNGTESTPTQNTTDTEPQPTATTTTEPTTTEGSVATDESQPESPPAPEPITRTTTEGCSYLPLEGNPSAGACLTLGQSCTINNQMGSCRTSTPEESMTTLCLCIPDSPPTTSTTTETQPEQPAEVPPTTEPCGVLVCNGTCPAGQTCEVLEFDPDLGTTPCGCVNPPPFPDSQPTSLTTEPTTTNTDTTTTEPIPTPTPVETSEITTTESTSVSPVSVYGTEPQPTSTNTFPAVETQSPTIPTQESVPPTTDTDLNLGGTNSIPATTESTTTITTLDSTTTTSLSPAPCLSNEVEVGSPELPCKTPDSDGQSCTGSPFSNPDNVLPGTCRSAGEPPTTRSACCAAITAPTQPVITTEPTSTETQPEQPAEVPPTTTEPCGVLVCNGTCPAGQTCEVLEFDPDLGTTPCGCVNPPPFQDPKTDLNSVDSTPTSTTTNVSLTTVCPGNSSPSSTPLDQSCTARVSSATYENSIAIDILNTHNDGKVWCKLRCDCAYKVSPDKTCTETTPNVTYCGFRTNTGVTSYGTPDPNNPQNIIIESNASSNIFLSVDAEVQHTITIDDYNNLPEQDFHICDAIKTADPNATRCDKACTDKMQGEAFAPPVNCCVPITN